MGGVAADVGVAVDDENFKKKSGNIARNLSLHVNGGNIIIGFG